MLSTSEARDMTAARSKHAAGRPAPAPSVSTEQQHPAEPWVARFKEGASDDELLELAFELWHQRVYRMTHRILGDGTEAEEVTQEAFESLLRALRNLRDPYSVYAYLTRCGVHAARNRLRRGRLRRISTAILQAAPRDPILDQDLALAVHQLLSRLNSRERVALVLRHVESYSLEESAQLMGVSVSSVQRLVRSAITKLRSQHDGSVLTSSLARWEEGGA